MEFLKTDTKGTDSRCPYYRGMDCMNFGVFGTEKTVYNRGVRKERYTGYTAEGVMETSKFNFLHVKWAPDPGPKNRRILLYC